MSAGFSGEFVALYKHAWKSFPLFDCETGEMYDDGHGNLTASPKA